MGPAMLNAFADELEKVAKKDIVSLLSSKALKAGVDPKKLPSIKQVGNVAASGERGRAAEIAQNVRGFLRNKKAA
jgi:hypothetical protein